MTALKETTNTTGITISEICTTDEPLSLNELATFEDASEVESDDDDIQMDNADHEEEDDDSATSSNGTSSKKDYHDLFLPEDTSSYQKPIVFSGGMNLNQCQEYYRALEIEEARRNSKRRRNQFFFGNHRRSTKSAKTVEFEMDPSDEAQLVDAIAVSAPSCKAIRRGSDSSMASTVSTSSCSSASTSSSLSDASSSSRITFDETVTVFPVPTIGDTPNDVWQQTWKPRHEVRAHKKRSKKEYAWDGYDWENATEEEDMIRDPETGLLEHPVHYESTHFSLAANNSRCPTFAFRLGMVSS
mmetsp:Transcript_9159/g.19631  ORF Transcript_9159/g.19631 Transcript_9159/m.19631 type:complete len:300 (-) Transcript_9159:99-998(-)